MSGGADTIRTITPTSRPTDIRLFTTPGLARTDGVWAFTGLMGGRAWELPTIRAPVLTHEARPRTVRTARVASRRRTTRAPGLTPRHGKDRMSTAAGAPPRFSAAMIGPRPIDHQRGNPA